MGRFFAKIIVSMILAILGVGAFFIGSKTLAQTQSEQVASVFLETNPSVNLSDLDDIPVDVTPQSASLGSDFVFTTGPIRYFNDGSVASGLVCKFRITAPDGTYFVLRSVTDSSGYCVYDTSQTPTDQGFVLEQQGSEPIDTDVDKIKSIIGVGNVTASVTHKNIDFNSELVEYDVFDQISFDDVEVVPGNIEVGDDLTVYGGPFEYTNGQPVADTQVDVHIQTPGGSVVVLRGYTDSFGNFTVNPFDNLEAQGVQLIEGSVNSINNRAGIGSVYLRITDFHASYETDTQGYQIFALTDTPRTGGQSVVVSGFIMILTLFVGYLSLKRGYLGEVSLYKIK